MSTEATPARARIAQVIGRLAALAPPPKPGTRVTASQLAAWIAVDAQRRWHRNRPGLGIQDWSMDELAIFSAGFIAVHVLAGWATGGEADVVAAQAVDALANGQGAGSWLALHLESLGIDADEVNRLEDELAALTVVTAAENIGSARAHIDAAARALGAPARDPGDDEDTARRVHAVRPGVPLHHVLAVVDALRVMGWGPGGGGPS